MQQNDDSNRAAARHLVESSYRLLDAERLAEAIRFALQEYNDETKPVVAIIREVTNKLKALETPNAALSGRPGKNETETEK